MHLVAIVARGVYAVVKSRWVDSGMPTTTKIRKVLLQKPWTASFKVFQRRYQVAASSTFIGRSADIGTECCTKVSVSTMRFFFLLIRKPLR